jgi:hypothetical protein
MTVRLYHREHSFSGNRVYEAKDVFDNYEQELFSAVVNIAEKVGKPVSLLVVPGTDVFDTILLTAQRLDASRVVCGSSASLTRDQQGKFTGDAWERLPEPKPRLDLELIGQDSSVSFYHLGPHAPRLRPEDLDLLHGLWLDVTRDAEFSGLHHYHIVSVALEKLKEELGSPQRNEILEILSREMNHKNSRVNVQ